MVTVKMKIFPNEIENDSEAYKKVLDKNITKTITEPSSLHKLNVVKKRNANKYNNLLSNSDFKIVIL